MATGAGQGEGKLARESPEAKLESVILHFVERTPRSQVWAHRLVLPTGLEKAENGLAFEDSRSEGPLTLRT